MIQLNPLHTCACYMFLILLRKLQRKVVVQAKHTHCMTFFFSSLRETILGGTAKDFITVLLLLQNIFSTRLFA